MTTHAAHPPVLEPVLATAAAPDPGAVAAAFREALALAESRAGATAPNPPVGCVILDAQGAVLARAAHEKAGEAHAEAAAIAACRAAGVVDQIHTVVVTLEPCNHRGRTPPCVEAILATPARAVWIGARDPNPRVAGGGAARLADAGLLVAFAEDLHHSDAVDLARAARRLIAPFAVWSREDRPFLTLKQALTAAGSMIPPPGRKTFTSEASLTLAHALRRRADAVVTGSGCILADDPAFTVRRLPDHPGKRRKLAILDRRGRVPESWLGAARARGLDPMVRGDLDALMAELAGAGVVEALVEAGPTLTAELLRRGLWDEHVVIRQDAEPGRPDLVTVNARRAW